MDPISIHHLILHPGSPKTATSGIQNALFRSRDSLLEQGFLYPLSGISTEGDVAFGHHDMARQINLEAPTPEIDFVHLMETLRIELDNYPSHKVILSSEEFFSADRIRYLSKIFLPEKCTVYLSLRPQHEVMNANYYTEVTHNRLILEPEIFFDQVIDKMSYLEMLDSFAALGPHIDIHLRLFQKGTLTRSDPLADFAATLGFHLPKEAAENAVEHPTLPAQPTLFLRWLNEIGFDQQSFFDIFESLHRMHRRLPNQMYTMSPAYMKATIKYFEAENREIRRRFLDGEDAPLFDEAEIPNAAQWVSEIGHNHERIEHDFLISLCKLAELK